MLIWGGLCSWFPETFSLTSDNICSIVLLIIPTQIHDFKSMLLFFNLVREHLEDGEHRSLQFFSKATKYSLTALNKKHIDTMYSFFALISLSFSRKAEWKQELNTTEIEG